jgi:opacity protein-like surface antigen
MNKKTILLILIICIYSFSINAQSKHTVSISLGAAVPVGDFGLKVYTNQNSRYASTGLILNLNYTYRVHKYVSAMAMLGAQNNPVDASRILSDVNVTSGGQFKSLTIPPTLKLSLLVGPEGKIPISKKISLNPYLLVGISRVFKPETLHTYINNDWGVNESKWSSCFTYQAGLGAEYNLSEKLFMTVKVDYNHSYVEFIDIKSYGSGGGSGYYNTSINITTINPSLGLGYKF